MPSARVSSPSRWHFQISRFGFRICGFRICFGFRDSDFGFAAVTLLPWGKDNIMPGFAIVGCGMVAGVHLKALAEIDGARVVAVVDSVPEALQRFASKHQ